MGKAEVVKAWRPKLRTAGLVYRDGYFQLKRTEKDHLHFGVSIQKNLHADSYKVNPTILLRNPLCENDSGRVILLANLRADGVHLHVNEKSWWHPDELPRAPEGIERYALPWFGESGRVNFLLEGVEKSISERKSLIEVLEPFTPEQQKAIAQAWHQVANIERRVAPMNLYFASVLHYLAGNRNMAIQRTKDWRSHIAPIEKKETALAQAQLVFLERVH